MSVRRSFVVFLTLELITASQVRAQGAASDTPRDQLQQLITQLQTSPNDQALREKIIALALMLDTKPATPDSAMMAEGAAEYAFKNAKVTSDYSDAAKQYEKALLLAPWLAADYFNCGVAHEKAGEDKEAIRSFSLYLLASPSADDAQAVKRRIGGLQYAEDQANSPEGRAEKEYGPAQRQFARLIQDLDGTVFVMKRQLLGEDFIDEVRFYRSGRYNLLMCHHRAKNSFTHLNGKRDDGVWEDVKWGSYQDGMLKWFTEEPVRPSEGGRIDGCRCDGLISADRETIVEADSRDHQTGRVWNRQ